MSVDSEIRKRFRHAVSILSWAPSPLEDSFPRAFATTGGAKTQKKARCLPTEALE